MCRVDDKKRFPDTEKISPPLLQLSEATFGYRPDKLVLERVNFDVSLDSRIAIVGANGAGKSTLYVQGHLHSTDIGEFISTIESSYSPENLRHCQDKSIAMAASACAYSPLSRAWQP